MEEGYVRVESQGKVQFFWRFFTFVLVFFVPIGIMWTLIGAYTGFVVFWSDYVVALFLIHTFWLVIASLIASKVYVVPDTERWVIYRNGVGRRKSYGPGLIFLIPFIDEIAFKIDRREDVMTISFNQVPLKASSGEGNIMCDPEIKTFITYLHGREFLSVLAVKRLGEQIISQVEGSIRRVATRFNIDDALTKTATILHNIAADANEFLKEWGVSVRVELSDWHFPEPLTTAWIKSEAAETEAKAQLTLAEAKKLAGASYRVAAEGICGKDASNKEIIDVAMGLAFHDVQRTYATGTGVVPFINVEGRKKVEQ